MKTSLEKQNHGGVIAIDRYGNLGIHSNIPKKEFITASRPQHDKKDGIYSELK